MPIAYWKQAVHLDVFSAHKPEYTSFFPAFQVFGNHHSKCPFAKTEANPKNDDEGGIYIERTTSIFQRVSSPCLFPRIIILRGCVMLKIAYPICYGMDVHKAPCLFSCLGLPWRTWGGPERWRRYSPGCCKQESNTSLWIPGTHPYSGAITGN